MPRKAYLDWLRGIAVIIMVGAHVTDAWTRVEDRGRELYGHAIFIAGFATPLFLFLAGLTLTLSASSRSAALGHGAAAAAARRRALQIFALAFLFRLQAQLLGWGPLSNFFKVDILNVMGLAMLAAAIVWGWSANRAVRIALFATATTVVAMVTPLVRDAAIIGALPDGVEAYLRPPAGRTTFALFPWAAFLFGGTIAGELIYVTQQSEQERRLQQGFAVAGVVLALLAYALSFRPSIYRNADFWTTSPTFFFIRLGVNLTLLPVAWWIDEFHAFIRRRIALPPDVPGRVITTLGRSSLFVYWIHVEMAYGMISLPLRRALPIELSLLGTVLLCALLYGIVRVKDRVMQGVTLTGPIRILSPILR